MPEPPPIILHVLDHALPELSGYSVRSHHVLRTLREHGLPVVGMAPCAGAAGEDRMDGVRYVRARQPAAAAGAARRVIDLFADVRRELGAGRVGLVHAHSPVRTGLPAFWAARRAAVPFVYELRGLWEETAVARRRMRRGSPRYRAGRRLETWLMRRVDALVAISSGLIAEAQRRGVAAERIVHVPNGVDTATFLPRAPDRELLERHHLRGRTVFGYLGFFFAYEGVDVLVRAFARLVPTVPGARLLLVGDGDTSAEVGALVSSLGLGDRVVRTGRVPHEEVPRYYSLCDAMAYPRRGWRVADLVTPLRPLEAMAMGRPVVASDVGGLRELVRDGETGLLCAPDDPAALGATLARLAGDPALRARLGDRARRFAAEERDWRRLAFTYAEVYARLLGAPAGQPGVIG